MIPRLAAVACTQSGLDNYAACCALLVQESGGGKNEWGHDPTIFIGGGTYGQPVTEESYAAYVVERDATHKYQGVGPCQLTYKGYQDQADALGGCWKPLANMTVGFGIIKGYRDAGLTWHETWKRYNGSDTYAVQMDARYAQWQAILNPPPPSELSFTSEYAAKAAQPQGETMNTKPYKAIAGFVLTFLAALLATVQGRTDISSMTGLDWAIVVGGALVTAGAVYGITNPSASS